MVLWGPLGAEYQRSFHADTASNDLTPSLASGESVQRYLTGDNANLLMQVSQEAWICQSIEAFGTTAAKEHL